MTGYLREPPGACSTPADAATPSHKKLPSQFKPDLSPPALVIYSMEELTASCEFLESALERYRSACIALEMEAYEGSAQIDLRGAFLKNLADKLANATSNKKKLRRCEMTLRRVRNHSPSIVPIHILPPEILTRIFNMLDVCSFKTDEWTRIPVPAFPETLTHVCSRWRQVALGSPALWSHIDLSPSTYQNLDLRLLSRAKVFASRSGKHVLDIHIGGKDANGDCGRIARFCTTIAVRTRSLEVFCRDVGPDRFKQIYSPVFDACLMHCVPGTLNHLAISGGLDKYSFIQSGATNRYIDSFSSTTEVDQRRLNELLLGVKALRLGINCIPATNRAYQGLVELHLMGLGMRFTEADFLGILAASPKLRILHLDVGIWPSHDSARRVQLPELEVLRLPWIEDRENLIRLLHPGARPLKLIFDPRKNFSISQSTVTAFVDLFGRSTVTELYIDYRVSWGYKEGLFNPFQLLELAPRLQILAVSHVNVQHAKTRLVHKSLVSLSAKSLPTLHLIGSHIDWTSCLDLVKTYDIQKITILGCSVSSRGRSGGTQSNQEVIRDLLAEICPVVQILDCGILELAGM